jgi:hypothetical protein
MASERRTYFTPPRRSGAILAALVEPHPPPGLHSSSLDRGVRVLEPEQQRVVVRVLEVGVALSLEGGDLVRDVGQLPSEPVPP